MGPLELLLRNFQMLMEANAGVPQEKVYHKKIEKCLFWILFSLFAILKCPTKKVKNELL